MVHGRSDNYSLCTWVTSIDIFTGAALSFSCALIFWTSSVAFTERSIKTSNMYSYSILLQYIILFWFEISSTCGKLPIAIVY